jgi:hypothetical protein
MPVYSPSLRAETLQSGPGATGFYIEDPLRLGEIPPAFIPDPAVPVFFHGQFLADEDLNVLFCKDGVSSYEPFDLTYSVGFFYDGTYDYRPIGNPVREALSLRVGRYRPNFIMGDKWLTGRYAIRWTYRVNAEDTESIAGTFFWLKTAGVYDRKPVLPNYDLNATVVVIP